MGHGSSRPAEHLMSYLKGLLWKCCTVLTNYHCAAAVAYSLESIALLFSVSALGSFEQDRRVVRGQRVLVLFFALLQSAVVFACFPQQDDYLPQMTLVAGLQWKTWTIKLSGMRRFAHRTMEANR